LEREANAENPEFVREAVDLLIGLIGLIEGIGRD
jgi:hypothetical protein